jgi:hypothetical protein
MKLEIYLRMANLPYEIVLNADYLRDRVRRSERPRGVSSRKTAFPGRKTNFPRHYWVRVPRQLALGTGRLAA